MVKTNKKNQSLQSSYSSLSSVTDDESDVVSFKGITDLNVVTVLDVFLDFSFEVMAFAMIPPSGSTVFNNGFGRSGGSFFRGGISGFIGLDYLGFILNCLREGI